MDLTVARKREKNFHERMRTTSQPLRPVDVEWVRREIITPTWVSGTDRYNDQRVEFHRILEREGGVRDRRVLDYGCGDGTWALYFRLCGAARVVGFDLAEMGVRGGMRRIEVQGEGSTVQLVCADASDLPFQDSSFDLVIGHGVLHHVIKYPRIFDELHRVMCPGSRAWFLENLADNPLFKLWWKLKGEVEEGDVPVFAGEVRRLASRFDEVEIVGMDFFHALTTFIFRQPLSGWRRAALRATKASDDLLFRLVPAARRWGAASIIRLAKR